MRTVHIPMPSSAVELSHSKQVQKSTTMNAVFTACQYILQASNIGCQRLLFCAPFKARTLLQIPCRHTPWLLTTAWDFSALRWFCQPSDLYFLLFRPLHFTFKTHGPSQEAFHHKQETLVTRTIYTIARILQGGWCWPAALLMRKVHPIARRMPLALPLKPLTKSPYSQRMQNAFCLRH